MPKSTSTPLAPPEQRAGTYARDDDVTGLLRYGTLRIFDLPRSRQHIKAGTADNCDLILEGEGISALHFAMTRRGRGLFVKDEGSTNGTARGLARNFGLALKPSFDDQRDEGDGFVLVPGMTLVVGTAPHRFIALDDAMRNQHPKLVEILGTEEEVQTATEAGETPSPSDLILAADSAGHVLITGKPGCEQAELARIIHMISKRREQPPVEIDHVPDDRRNQSALFRKAAKGTLVLHLGADRKPLDESFVSSMFSASYNIRVIVVARTANQARRALGHQHWRSLMHCALCPLAMRRTAIFRLLDQWLAAEGSALRVSDLTPINQRALLRNAWRENLDALRTTAVRLATIVRAEFSRGKAADLLGIKRQTFYHWYNNAMHLSKDLVSDARKRALLLTLTAPARPDV